MKKLPILFIIPHGGYNTPDELRPFTNLDPFDTFMSADSCVNELFSFQNEAEVLNTSISKLFLDLNRKPDTEIAEDEQDALIKRVTPFGKQVFVEKVFPTEVAVINLIKRYYNPFHEKIEKIINEHQIELIIVCHTVLAIGAKTDLDHDKPRPLFRIYNNILKDSTSFKSAPDILCETLRDNLKKIFAGELTNKEIDNFQIAAEPINDHIMQKYSGKLSILRLDISRELFINDKYFNYDYLKVDQLRISDIKEMIWDVINRMYNKFYL
jgi:hypothetical protein